MNTEMYKPKVSVIMPAYNAGTFIKQAVDSVLNQSFTDFELIVVDDGSTDNTMSVLGEYGDSIRVISQENSGGPAGPRNKGIKAAAGQYIAFFDSDDIMHPLQLQNSVSILDYAPETSLCFSNFVLMGQGEYDTTPCFDREYIRGEIAALPAKSIGGNLYVCTRPIYSEILHRNIVHTSTVMLRKSIIEELGMFDETLLRGDDYDLWLRFARSGKIFGFCTDVMSHYRMRSGSVSRKICNQTSYIGMLEKMYRQELSPTNRKIIGRRLAGDCLSHGTAMRDTGRYGKALHYYSKGVIHGYAKVKRRSIIAICKIPAIMLLHGVGIRHKASL